MGDKKHLIENDINRNFLKVLCISQFKHRVLVIVLIILLTIIVSLLAIFGLYTLSQTSPRSPTFFLKTSSSDSEKAPTQFTCRAKRSTNEISRKTSEEASNVNKRNVHYDDIGDFLEEKYHEVIVDEVPEAFDTIRYIDKRSDYLKNSIHRLEKILEKSQNFIKSLAENEDKIDDETAILIQKDINDVDDEMNGLDDDIVSLLETSDLVDKTVHNRVRHKREVDEENDLNPVALALYTPVLEEKKREKRLIQQKLSEVRNEFIRCKKSATDTAPNDCDKVYRKVVDRFRQITKKFREIEEIVDEMETLGNARSSDENSSEEKKKKKKKKKSSEEDSSEEKHKSSTVAHTTLDDESETTTILATTTVIETTTTDIDTTTIHKIDAADNEIDAEPRVQAAHVIVQPGYEEETTTISAKLRKVDSTCPATKPKIDIIPEHHRFVPEFRDVPKTVDQMVNRKIERDGIQDNLETLVDAIENIITNDINIFPSNQEQSAESSEVGASQKFAKTSSAGRETFTSLCENLSKSSASKQAQLDNVVPIPLSAGGFHFPPTGETMKASSKVVMNPGFNIMPYPVCFVQYPHYRPQPMYYPNLIPVMQPTAQPGGNASSHFDTIDPEFIRANDGYYVTGGGQFQKPIPIQTISSTNQGYRSADQENAPTYCAFLPNDGSNFPAYYEQTTARPIESTTKRSDDAYSKGDESARAKAHNIPSQFDIIYATYPNQIFAMNNSAHHHCDSGKLPCFSTNQCIPKSKWCDSKVDCVDASDESACSCKARLPERRICDGFIDCPMGSDELGCFGCDKFQYSCYGSQKEFEENGESPVSMCYASTEKCDGFNNCRNGKDEVECSMIVKNLGSVTSYSSAYSEGILHRNYKGRWYPVCKNPNKWALEACQAEIGDLSIEPILSVKSVQMAGPFIQPSVDPQQVSIEPTFTDECHLDKIVKDENHIVFVKCPPPECGISSIEVKKIKREADEENLKQGRIVGGNEASPMEFPFIVAIYKDGNFHCGGSIYNEHWIITAAHCTRAFENHYYEARAGILRRASYSPMAQIVKVTHVIRHEDYERATMHNDIALMRVKHHFNFNKWVRPICLPSKERTGIKDWLYGPAAGTICTTLGWGAIREKGPDPDELQVVDVPILPKCKYLNDQAGESVCAGEKIGLRDACQGDSGGPLVCKSVNNPRQWYLTGIVSHGEGCARANEPGVYTRTALYLNWIIENTDAHKPLPSTSPRQDCPGVMCVWGAQKCISRASRCDGFVNCLGGEDEVDCPLNWLDLLLGDGKQDQNQTILSSQHQVHHEQTTEKHSHNSSKNNSTHHKKSSINPNQIEENASEAKKLTKKDLKNELFRCTKITQMIDISHRCDRIFDCEDGTDEMNCTCKDHLKGPFSKLICDGHVHCADSTDEIGCLKCNDDEFGCPLSKTCIKKSKQCDGRDDCLFQEDERDCIALTDGHSISLDVNGKPFFHSKGIVTRNLNSIWQILCDDSGTFLTNGLEIASDFCHYIGFKGAKSFETVNMTSFTIDETRNIRNRSLIKSTTAIDKNNRISHCLALEIDCLPNEANFTSIRPIDIQKIKRNQTTHIDHTSPPFFKPINESDGKNIFLKPVHEWNHLKDFDWPWSAEIFSNGEIIANGILLDKSWVLAEKTIFGNEQDYLKTNFVTVLLGNSKSNLGVQSPYEEISRVDCIQHVENSNTFLLHLESPIHFNRHVLPSFLPIDSENEIDTRCIAVAMGFQNNIKSVGLNITRNCKNEIDVTCYQVPLKSNETCSDNETSHRVAAIVCKTKSSSWYPKAFHKLQKGFCELTEPTVVFDLQKHKLYHVIQNVIDNSKCTHSVANITCETFRCPLGNCLSRNQLCNGIADCHDATDEVKTMCESHTEKSHCAPHEFKCRNGKCIEKTKFCNHIDECGDRTDEPSECTCFDYLRSTNPRKICDGIIHCWDRSDEDVVYCGDRCPGNANSTFKCEGSIFCVPIEIVCDNRLDCPDGSDEKYCHGLFEHNKSDGFAEVMKRTMGVWHTKCYPKSTPPTQKDVEEMCQQLGMKSESPSAKVRGHNIHNLGEDNTKNIQFLPIDVHIQNATKAVTFSKFAPIKISNSFTVHLKTDKPLAKIVAWDKSDDENCLRLEIKCM